MLSLGGCFFFERVGALKYTKAPLVFDKQVELLCSRGMQGDPDVMHRCLSSVSYYRLSGYWFHRRLPDDSFRPGTNFSVVWDQYVFDRKLRLVVMDAIERIEVGLRTQFSYHHAHTHGPFGYATDPAALPKLQHDQRQKLLERIDDEIGRSKERFVEHFQLKYGSDHQHLPIWMATEAMSLGCVLQLWQASTKKVKNEVSATFNVADEVLRTWFWSLNEIRNVCAHHGRLWNRGLGNKPTIPRAKHHPEWHTPVSVPNDRIFSVLTICAHSLRRLAPQSKWHSRLRDLLNSHPNVPIKNMGFPSNWMNYPMWKGIADG